MKEPTTVGQIEEATKKFSEQRARVKKIVEAVTEEVNRVQRAYITKLRQVVQDAAASEAELETLLESAPELFVKPRTFVFHGIKVGYGKRKGCIEIEDDVKTIALIKKHLPKLADVLISTSESVSKDSLSSLTGDDLKRIGCGVTKDTDAVVIKPTDGEIDKAVTALLKGAVEEIRQAAA